MVWLKLSTTLSSIVVTITVLGKHTYQVPQYLAQNKFISEILDIEDKILLSILDPLSSKLPDSVTKNWWSPHKVYKLFMQLCFDIHSKRKKVYDDAKKLS
jgi:hypothetical protein